MTDQRGRGFPAGHFYSPIPDWEDLATRREQLWPPRPPERPGIEWHLDAQRVLLERVSRDLDGCPYVDADDRQGKLFAEDNPFFAGLDAVFLHQFLRLQRPARVVEIGSGFSTRLLLDAVDLTTSWQPLLTVIDPYPDQQLAAVLATRGARLLRQPVQEAGLVPFRELGAGDVLFIDSSHVAKIGSDVVFLVLEVLPRLPAGCLIHFHDIFLPWDYPQKWVLGEGRAWNEQYLVQCLLVHSRSVRLVFSCAAAHTFFREHIERCFGRPLSGGSLWLERVGPSSGFEGAR